MSRIRLQSACVFYIIIDMCISIDSAKAGVCSARENAYYQPSLRAKRRNRGPSFWTSCGEDVSSLSPARLRQSSATLLSGVRPFPPQRPLGRTPNGRRPSRALAVSPVFLHCVPCRPPLRYASFHFTSAPFQEVGDPPRLALATPALAAGWLRGCWLTTTANTKMPKGQPDDHTSQVSIPDASAVTTP